MDTKTITLNPTAILTKTNLFYAVIFALPMITHGPQLIVGTAINTMLFLGAKKLTNKELIPLAVLPSLGALTNGILFGSLTMFLIYFAPAIWLSNYLLMMVFKKVKNLSNIFKILLASIAKASLLFFVASVMFNLNIVPKVFLNAMGSTQVLTTVLGGTIALGINKTGVINNE